jgi:hypothetical protein
VDQAFQFLADPMEEYPPKELQHLNHLEWQVLSQLLSQLYEEKSQHRVQ